MAEVLLNHSLEIGVLPDTVAPNDFVHPFVDSFGVNLQRPHNSSEQFHAPRVSEDLLHIGDVHAKGVGETALDFEGNVTKLLVCF